MAMVVYAFGSIALATLAVGVATRGAEGGRLLLVSAACSAIVLMAIAYL